MHIKSEPGNMLSNMLNFRANLSLNMLIGVMLIKRKRVYEISS